MATTSKSHKSRKQSAGVDAAEAASTALAAIPPTGGAAKNVPNLTPDDTEPVSTPQELPAIKQGWYRAPDSKVRLLVNKIVVMRQAGRKDEDIAKRLGKRVQTIANSMYIGRKNGWLDADDDTVDVEAELAINIDGKIVRNISASLDGRMTNWQTHEMTLAAAKGRGMFKSGEGKGDASTANQLPVVAIQIVMPVLGAGDQMPEVKEDQMGGTPAFLEGEVDGSDDQ